MADDTADRSELLRREYHQQTGMIPWKELQTYYAHGSVVSISSELDLVDVAVQLGLDNTDQFQQWIANGKIAPVVDAQALAWYEGDASLWAVVAPPWVLVQLRPGTTEPL